MIFVLDNYDSFTYNLVHILYTECPDIVVKRNDEVTVDAVLALHPEAIVLSPGPGRPEKAGILLDLIGGAARRRIPTLGVCLGHQGIGAYFGAKVVSAQHIMHGKISTITHDGKGLFAGLTEPFTAVRYHSLVLDADTLPPELEITCKSDDGEVMGVRHRELPIEGIQYHPESILSATGKRQLSNFLGLARGRKK